MCAENSVKPYNNKNKNVTWNVGGDFEENKSVLGNRVLLLHAFGLKHCNILTTSNLVENKSILEYRVLLLHGLDREPCSIVTTSDFRDNKNSAGR